ncbi:MAG TPA: thiamine phosphate synthase [Pyrinomonadaceae bacterium]|nr:thiamine phosphate synthase [Pyrinomonadaceae bacterium]
MEHTIPPIYPITDTTLSGIPIPEQVERSIAGGATLIQLRDKLASSSEFYKAAVHSVRIAHEAKVRIIVNDRADIAMMSGADGVHLGQADLPPAHVREIMGPNAIIGLSTHDLAQVKAALAEPVDYIAFGPIFPTLTKEKPDPTVGLALLKEARRVANDLPLVAIGGLNEDNIASVFEAGADSVAVISAVMSDPEQISARMRILLAIKSAD